MIHKIPPGACNKNCIGETYRELEKRVGEHKRGLRSHRETNTNAVYDMQTKKHICSTTRESKYYDLGWINNWDKRYERKRYIWNIIISFNHNQNIPIMPKHNQFGIIRQCQKKEALSVHIAHILHKCFKKKFLASIIPFVPMPENAAVFHLLRLISIWLDYIWIVDRWRDQETPISKHMSSQFE